MIYVLLISKWNFIEFCFIWLAYLVILVVLFLKLWWSCIYTGADEIAGNRAPQWAAEGLNKFKVLLCFIF